PGRAARAPTSSAAAGTSGWSHLNRIWLRSRKCLSSAQEVSRRSGSNGPLSAGPGRDSACDRRRRGQALRTTPSGRRPRDRSRSQSNTVLRSLRLLQDEGLLELRRRRGATVAGTPERGAVMEKVRELVEFARGQGYAIDEIIEMIEDVA